MAKKTSRSTQPDKPLGRRLLFLCFVMSPLAVLALLMWLVAVAIERGPQMENQRIGAGAGDTGGANAIGDIMAGRWDGESDGETERQSEEGEVEGGAAGGGEGEGQNPDGDVGGQR